MNTHPLLGTYEPDLIGEILGTRYQRFASPSGIHGLARWTNEQLELLAVHAEQRNAGQFRKFITEAKKHFKTINVWLVENQTLAHALQRYGFNSEQTVDEFGDDLSGYRWDAPV